MSPSKLHIGNNVYLPVDAVTETLALLAMRGAGKTYAGGDVAEEILKQGVPLAVGDPTGAWYGLRSSADGKHVGFPVTVLGGDHADEALVATAGKVVANLFVQENRPLVLDLSHFSKGDMKRFMCEFLERVYETSRSARHIILDEADALAPQRTTSDRGGYSERLLGAVDEIVRRGRIRGIGTTLITQRSAVLNKNVLSQISALFAMRTKHPNDQKPIWEWLEANAIDDAVQDEMRATIASLKNGDAWFLATGWMNEARLIHFRAKETFDSSRTPKVGEKRIVPKVLAPVDLVKLREAMKETVERAAANDPIKLKARVAQLEAELRKKATPAAVKIPLVGVPAPTAPAITAAELKQLEQLNARMEAAAEKCANAAASLRGSSLLARQLKRIGSNAAAVPPPAPRLVEAFKRHAEVAAAPTSWAKAAPEFQNAGGTGLGKGEKKIFTAVAQHAAGVTREQLMVLTGYKRSSRDTYLQRLTSAGLVAAGDDGRLHVTTAGTEALGDDFEPLPTGEALIEHWRTNLPSGELKIFEAVLSAGGLPVEKDHLLEVTPYKRSSRDTYIQRLRARRLIDDSGSTVQLSKELAG